MKKLVLFVGILIVLFVAGCESETDKQKQTIQQIVSSTEYCHPLLEKKPLTDFCKEILSTHNIIGDGKKISDGYSCILNVSEVPENACPSGTQLLYQSDELPPNTYLRPNTYICSSSTPFQATCLPGYNVTEDHSQESFEVGGDYKIACMQSYYWEYWMNAAQNLYVFGIFTTVLSEEEMTTEEAKSYLNETILQLNQYFCANSSATVVIDSYTNESKARSMKLLAIEDDDLDQYCCFYSEK